jgi:hypothetical protein
VAHGSTNPSQRYFYTNWLFVPATSNGSAPYRTWGWAFVITTGDWFNDGKVPNLHDFAIIQAVDHGTTRIGALIGWLGWFEGQISSNHLTILGYPCNLDNCARMQRTDAQTFAFGGNNTWIYGSSMRGGAGGGPWVRDFGIGPSGNPATSGGNWATAATSYIPMATNIGFLGASQLDDTWVSIWNSFCAHRMGNC